jgi:predicted component of type VI protein secretion system
MFRSDGERRSFSIARDMTVIGRREDCDLRIPLGEVSRKHCRVVRDSDILKIEDLGSSNGTYLNGRRVQEALLSPGDSIQVGPVVFVLQIDGEPDDEDLSPITIETQQSEAGSGANGQVEAMHPGDELEEVETLEELPDAEGAGPAPTRSATPAAEEDDVQLDEIEPLQELDPLEPDLEEEQPAQSSAGGSKIHIDADDKH